MLILEFTDVSKAYTADAPAVNGISFSIQSGELTALAGPSGSGKSTLLNLAAGLDQPTSGSIVLLSHNLKDLNPDGLSELRRNSVGFVFQAYNLFPVLNALENVEYPLALRGIPKAERKKLAMAALEEVGLKDFAKRFPSQLSGGQQQRVAIARAVVTKPQIIFADEPTANVDSNTAEKLLELFRTLNETKGMTFLFSSHDPRVLKMSRRTLEIANGKIVRDSAGAKANVLTFEKKVEAPPAEVAPLALPAVAGGGKGWTP